MTKFIVEEVVPKFVVYRREIEATNAKHAAKLFVEGVGQATEKRMIERAVDSLSPELLVDGHKVAYPK